MKLDGFLNGQPHRVEGDRALLTRWLTDEGWHNLAPCRPDLWCTHEGGTLLFLKETIDKE